MNLFIIIEMHVLCLGDYNCNNIGCFLKAPCYAQVLLINIKRASPIWDVKY